MTKLNMKKGLIPLPPVRQRLIPDRCTRAWDDLGQRVVRGITLHRMQGTLWGTDQYFRDLGSGGQAGLTDFGIDNGSGELLQWNDPRGAAQTVYLRGDPANGDYAAKDGAGAAALTVSANRAGWASGPVKGAYGDGAAFVERYGIAAVNRDRVSLEIGGWFAQPGEPASREEPVSAVCWEHIAQFCAHFAHDAGITWDRYPLMPDPQDDFSFICWHQEFTLGTGKVCPGRVVMDGTDALIARTKAIMRQVQEGGPNQPPVYVAAHPVPGPVADKAINGHDYVVFRRTLRTVRTGVACREYAEPSARPTRAPLAKGVAVNLAYLCRGSDNQIYAVGTGGSRLLLADLIA